MRRDKGFAYTFTSFVFALLVAHVLSLFLPAPAVSQPAREPVIYLESSVAAGR